MFKWVNYGLRNLQLFLINLFKRKRNKDDENIY